MKKTNKIFSLALALLMVVPMLAAFAVSADAAFVSYNTASDGGLLANVNFNGVTGVYEPGNGGETAWDTINATPSADGKSVTMTSQRTHDKGRAIWGGSFADYTVTGKSYTVQFTVTVENSNSEVGFYPDGGAGFIVAPALNRYRVGQWGNQTKILGTNYYLGSGAKTQTYAVEMAFDNSTKATTYQLFVKTNSGWVFVAKLSRDVECYSIKGTKQLDGLVWEPTENELLIKFFMSVPSEDTEKANPGTETDPVTVSDVAIYKGLTIGSTAVAQKTPVSGGNIDAASKEDGELLYKVNFAGDANYTPAGLTGLPTLNASVDASNNGKVTLSVPAGEDGLNHYWGGAIAGLSLTGDAQYTILIEVERDPATAANDPFLGFSFDGNYYVVGDSSNTRLVVAGEKGTSDKGFSHKKKTFADDALMTVVGDHGADYGTLSESFKQYIAIEIDCAKETGHWISVNYLTTDGTFEEYTCSSSTDIMNLFNDNLSIYFYQNKEEQPVTVNSVEIYKGRTIEAINENGFVPSEETSDTGASTDDTDDDNNKTTDTAGDKTTETKKTETETSAQAEKKSGCGSVIGASSMFVAVVAVAAVPFIRKKKNDGI